MPSHVRPNHAPTSANHCPTASKAGPNVSTIHAVTFSQFSANHTIAATKATIPKMSHVVGLAYWAAL